MSQVKKKKKKTLLMKKNATMGVLGEIPARKHRLQVNSNAFQRPKNPQQGDFWLFCTLVEWIYTPAAQTVGSSLPLCICSC